MKKIILLLFAVLFAVFNVWGQSISLSGPKSAIKGKEYSYTIDYGALLQSYVAGSIWVNKGYAKTSAFAIPAGNAFTGFRVIFTEVTDNASVRVTDGKGEAIISGIRVMESSNYVDPIIVGSDSIYWNEPLKYSLTNYRGGVIRWYSSPSASISYLSSSNKEEIELRIVSQVKGVVLWFTIQYPGDGFETGYPPHKTIKVIYPEIKTSERYACLNGLVEFKVQGYKPSSTISWQSTPTMTLVSGQGTPTATYRASSNGYGTVKVDVSYGGKSYTAENSSVWVGAPPTPNIGGDLFTRPRYYNPNEGYAFWFSDESDLVTGYSWTASGQNWKQTSKNNSIYVMLPSYTGVQSSRFLIRLNTENKCGVSPTATFAGYIHDGSGNGGVILKSSATDLSPSSTLSPVSIKVYRFNTGALVYSEKGAVGFNIGNTTLPEGVYIVVSTDADGKMTSEKTIKNR